MAVYLTPTELTLFYDVRRVLELSVDTGAAPDVSTLASNPRVLQAIRSASAELDSALQVGQRYDRSVLEGLLDAARAGGATEAEKKRASPIQELVAHLAYGRLVGSRGYSAEKMQQLAPMLDTAQDMLNRLAGGERIFDLDAPKASGVPTPVTIGASRLRWSQYSRMFGVFPESATTTLYPYSG